MSKFPRSQVREPSNSSSARERNFLVMEIGLRMEETGLDEDAARDLLLRERQTQSIVDAIDRLTEQLKRNPLRVID